MFVITLRGIPGNIIPTGEISNEYKVNEPPFETSMERGRYALTSAIVEHHTFNVDSSYSFLKPDLAWYSGHYYSAFPPGVSLMGVPLYYFGSLFNANQLFTYFTSALFTISTIYLMFLISKRLFFSTQTTLIVCFFYAFGTSVWAYSVSYSAHTISAFFVTLALYLYLCIREKPKKYLSYMGLWTILGINLFVDYPNLLILTPITFFAFFKTVKFVEEKHHVTLKFTFNWLYTITPFLIFATCFVLYNLHHYQKPVAFTNTYNLALFERQGINLENKTLSNDIFRTKKPYFERFSPDKVERGVKVLLTSFDRGIIYYSPFFIFSLIGLYYSRKKKLGVGWVISLTFLINLLFYSSFDDPWGGWGFGPRYLIPTMSLLSLLVGIAFEHFIRKGIFTKIVLTCLAGFSIVVNLLGAITTNAVPTGLEAKYLNLYYNYFYNWEFLQLKGTSSFIYNALLKDFFSPVIYFYVLATILLIIMIILVWKKREKEWEANEIKI